MSKDVDIEIPKIVETMAADGMSVPSLHIEFTDSIILPLFLCFWHYHSYIFQQHVFTLVLGSL